MLNLKQIYLFGQIQTSQTGGPLYSDTAPYQVSERSWDWYNNWKGERPVEL